MLSAANWTIGKSVTGHIIESLAKGWHLLLILHLLLLLPLPQLIHLLTLLLLLLILFLPLPMLRPLLLRLFLGLSQTLWRGRVKLPDSRPCQKKRCWESSWK